jgi:non-specific serine/threonine protein kinase/serine/threonine-protein kinase
MTPERWLHIKDLFNRALERDPAERAAYMAAEAGDDRELLGEVQSLLSAHEEAGEALERPRVHLDAEFPVDESTVPGVGRYVGPYRLLREVGWGGMGAVYEALREDKEFRKRAAVKIVRREMASEAILVRFRLERQILAGLDHPHIAALFDGGVTGDGRPWFAMEFVEGQPIDEYCRAQRLAVRERVALFLEVCAAVEYAHRNLVVHRDLKPGNILVTADRRPKLLDFGIAKLLGEEQDASRLTRAGDLLLTPDYASPEQVCGGSITTATDVYSLGVILYELLARTRPYRLQGRPLQDIVRTITDHEPRRPSDAIEHSEAPGGAQGAGARLRRQLAGDLDSIVLRAIRKEPEQRYASVAQLREDLQRYLDGRPVLARQGSTGYRVRKFIVRHAAAVSGITLLMLVLAGGVVSTLLQAQRAEAERARAEERFNDLRGLASSVLFEIHDSIADLPGATATRSLLIQRGLEYLNRLSRQSGDDSSIQREVAQGYIRLGLVQGTPTSANLGDLDGARRSYALALATAQNLLERNPDDLEARRIEALAHEKTSDLDVNAGRLSTAVGHARAALASWRRVSEQTTDRIGATLPLVVSHIKLGDMLGNPVFPNRGDPSGAMTAYQNALRMIESLPPEARVNSRVRRYTSILYERVGEIHMLGGRNGPAMSAYQSAFDLRQQLLKEKPTNRDALRDMGVAHEKICGMLLATGDPNRALPSCRQALELYERLHSSDRLDVQALGTVATGHLWMYRALNALGQLPEAEAELQRSTELLGNVLDLQRDNVQAQRDFAYNALYSSMLNERVSRLPGLPSHERTERRVRAVADFERGKELLKTLDTQGIGTAADVMLVQEARVSLGQDATKTMDVSGP